jgi:hypothetical protein
MGSANFATQSANFATRSANFATRSADVKDQVGDVCTMMLLPAMHSSLHMALLAPPLLEAFDSTATALSDSMLAEG